MRDGNPSRLDRLLATLVVSLASCVCSSSIVACSSPSPSTRRPLPESHETEGCDRERLREVLSEVNGRRGREDTFHGRVPVGELVDIRLERCEVGEALAACRARFEDEDHRIYLLAQSEVRYTLEAVEPSDEIVRRLASHAGEERRFDFGRRIRREVITAPEVCVRRFALQTIRVPQLLGRGPGVRRLIVNRRDYPDVAAARARDDAVLLRCRAEGERLGPPPLEREGPCGGLLPPEGESP